MALDPVGLSGATTGAASGPVVALAGKGGSLTSAKLNARLSREQLQIKIIDHLTNGSGAPTVLPDILALLRTYSAGDGSAVPRHERSLFTDPPKT